MENELLTKDEELELEIRHYRDILLTHIDKYQKVLIYDDLSDTQKEELKIYRKGLLEAPQNLELPKAPEWILNE